jgi:hypothetical protein
LRISLSDNSTIIAFLFFILSLSSCDSNNLHVSKNNYVQLPKIQSTTYKSPQEREKQDRNNTLGISISGGGSRAQYFGLGTLIALDEIKKNETIFLNQIDYFSTVSGGGFAAGYYLSLKKNNVLKSRTLLDFWKSQDRKDVLQEYLFKSANATSIFKLWGYERNLIFKSYPSMIDRELLQYNKKYNDTIIKRLYLRDFFIPENSDKKVLLPMFVTNGTVYNNGERFPFMPHIIDYMKVSGSSLPNESFSDIDHGYGFPLSYAISGSAAFPGVLPMLKLTIKDDNNNVVGIIDGGAVDNLGFKTLFELLNADKSNNIKKRALIVNCAGFGLEEQLVTNEKIGIGKLLKKSLLYSVDINLLNSETEIPDLATKHSIDYVKIGFLTLKDEFKKMNSDPRYSNQKSELDSLVKLIERKKNDWEDVYRDFAKRDPFRDYNKIKSSYNFDNISEIPTSRFSEFGLLEVFELFELSSQIETKIKIYPWEKEVLILAGRYAVYLKSNQIAALLN